MNKEYIVKSTMEFQEILNSKSHVKSEDFIIHKKKSDDDKVRFGVTVPKKLGNAVLRNRNKRQIKEILMSKKNMFKLSYDYVIITRKSFISKNYQDKSISLINTLIKIKAFKECNNE